MDVQRLGVKVFAVEPVSVSLRDFIPVFHAWIQRRAVEQHLLIDIHDYSHVYQGPGILLVAHEGNFSIDSADGRLGLLYYRKQPIEGSPEDRLTRILKSSLEACRLLQEEPSLRGLRFRTDEMLIVANDRLLAANDKKTFSELEPVLSTVFKGAFGGSDVTITSAGKDPKERFSVRVQTAHSAELPTLIDRLNGRLSGRLTSAPQG